MEPHPVDPGPSEEVLSPPPHLQGMERSLSSDESVSDSSVSTERYIKSGSWSHSVSVASSSQSSSDLEVASRLMNQPSPSRPGGDDIGGADDDDRLSTTGDEKRRASDPDAFEFFPAEEGTSGAGAREKRTGGGGSPSGGAVSGDREEKDDDGKICCDCWCCKCKSSTAGDVAGDLLSIVCCPCSVVQMLLACLCGKVPRLVKARTKDRSGAGKSAGAKPPVNPAVRKRAHDSDFSKELSEHSQDLEEPEESPVHAAGAGAGAGRRTGGQTGAGQKSGRGGIGRDDSKAYFRALTLSAMSPTRLPGTSEEDEATAKEKAEKIERMKAGYNEQQNFFFPSPEKDDKAGGR